MWAIKKRALAWRSNRILKSGGKSPRTVPFSQAKTVGILFEYKQSSDVGKARIVADRWSEQGKQVKLFCYSPKPLAQELVAVQVLTRKDFGLLGQPKGEDAQEFVEKPLDYFFYFGSAPDEALTYLLTHTPARCRVGAYQEPLVPYLDLLMQGPAAGDWQGVVNEFSNLSDKLRSAS